MSQTPYPPQMWNERYSNAEYVYGTTPNDFLKSHTHIFPQNSNILCLCEGEGRNGIYLATEGHKVTAVDFSEAAKTKAIALASQNKVTINYQVANLNTYPLGTNKWDAIVSIFAHTPQILRQKIHSQITPALKSNGIFLLEAYSKEQINNNTGGPKDINMLLDLSELTTTFTDLKILHAKQFTRHVQEGAHHTGEAAITQFIAQKQL